MKENAGVATAAQSEPKRASGQRVEKEKEKEAQIYIGPSFRGTVSGTVLKNGLTPALEEVIRLCPAVGELVVPVRGLVQANKELRKPDSAMMRFFKQAEIFYRTYKKGEINSGR